MMNPWVIGWVASDGHNNGERWSVSQNSDDADVMWIIYNLFSDAKISISCGNKAGRYGTKDQVIVCRKSSRDCEILEEWGIQVGNKTISLRFPNGKERGDIWMYLRGMFEGDGTAYLENGRNPRLEIVSSRLWCNDCKKWLDEQNIDASVYDEKRSHGIAYLRIGSSSDVTKFIRGIYDVESGQRMGRKFGICSKVMIAMNIFDIEARNNLSCDKRNRLRSLIENDVRDGLSAVEISRRLNCPLSFAMRVRRELVGSRKQIKQKKASEIHNLLKDGRSRADIVRLGYGYKLVRQVADETVGSVKEKQEKKVAAIREMILKGESVSGIVDAAQCSAGRVIRERRWLAEHGYTVKLNKRRRKNE